MRLRALLLTALLCTLLTGCISSGNRQKVLNALIEEQLIPSDWTFVHEGESYWDYVPIANEYNYVYKDSKDILHMVQIADMVTEDGNDFYYPVAVYDTVCTVEKERSTVSGSDTTVKTYTAYEPSEDSGVSRYEVRMHQFLFWKWWTVNTTEVE